ncbi:MAG: HAD family hydrolase, partial [Desulforhabdus sp.]|nr:HAD family hydrolase [Desulforhabdus sp.]
MRKAVFLDRDGVINKVVMRKGKICSPRTVREFEWEDGVEQAVSMLKQYGYLVIVATNQPDIARSRMTRISLDTMTEKIYRSLSVDSVWVCPHDDTDGCGCRKPKPGMLLDAARVYGIDCGDSFMVGDTWKDMETGRAAKCKTILLDRPYNQRAVCHYRVKNLLSAV